MKKLVGNLALLLIALLVAFTFLEVSIRIFLPQTTNIYQYDEDYLFQFRPYSEITYVTPDFTQTSSFNSHGFRDNEYAYENKPADTYRIIFLGDSMTAGLEVDLNQTYPKLVEQRLRKEFPNKNIEVLNVAANGWSTEQQLIFMEKNGINYSPDLVVLAYALVNDQMDNVQRNLFNFDGSNLTINKDRPLSQSRLRSVYYFFSTRFHTFNFFLFNYWRIKDSLKHVDEPHKIEYQDTFPRYLLKDDPADVKYEWAKTEALLDRMQASLSNNNSTLMLMIIPAHFQEQQELRKRAGLVDAELVLDKPQQILINYSTSRKLQYVDLLPAFKSRSKETLHPRDDVHWNAAGHALAASEMSTKLINHLSRTGFNGK